MDKNSNLGFIRTVVFAAAAILMIIAIWGAIIEFYAEGAPAGQTPTGKIDYNATFFVNSIQHGMMHLPIVKDQARGFLEEERDYQDHSKGPQAVWREWSLWWGILMVGTAALWLFVKRWFETPNDETSVMHLKGDTDTALRAKGFRG